MLVGAFNIFNEVFIMTRGGPLDSTHTIVMEIYGFSVLQDGRGRRRAGCFSSSCSSDASPVQVRQKVGSLWFLGREVQGSTPAGSSRAPRGAHDHPTGCSALR